MGCEQYIEFKGASYCLDIPRSKPKWPPDPPEWLKYLRELIGGPLPDPWQADILDGIRLPGVEQGSWSRDLSRVVEISRLAGQFEAPELREQFGALLRQTSDELLGANAPEVRIELNI